ncbi:MAG: hypothetical protein AAF657_22285 [Acidobacteriota bacterium]
MKPSKCFAASDSRRDPRQRTERNTTGTPRTLNPGSQDDIRVDDGSQQTNPHIDPDFPDDPP